MTMRKSMKSLTALLLMVSVTLAITKFIQLPVITYKTFERPSTDTIQKVNIVREDVQTERIMTTVNEEVSQLKQSILEDMNRCSLSMGVSSVALERREDNMNQIAQRASTFLSAFWQIVPHKYISGLKNPCWYSNLTVSEEIEKLLVSNLGQYQNSLPRSMLPWLYKTLFKQTINTNKLFCLPQFLMAGFPKCGTTTLHSVLSRHRQVATPEMKEPHWWARVPLGDMNTNYLKLLTVRYLLNFKSAAIDITHNNATVTYDASQTTLIDSNFNIDNEDYCAMATVVNRVLPDAKIVILMREPVARIFSHFYYMYREQTSWPAKMKSNPPLYFHNHIKATVNDFQHCLQNNNSVYECANSVRTRRRELQSWLGIGIYYIQILQWMQFWPRENFLFLKTEEMASDSFSVMNKITEFLSLERVNKEDTLQWFSEKKNARKSFLRSKKYEMLPETREILEQFFAPYNKKLEKLVGIDWAY